MNHMVAAFMVLGLAAVYVLAAPSIDKEIGENGVLAVFKWSIQDKSEDSDNSKELDTDGNDSDENTINKTNVDMEMLRPDNGVPAEVTEEQSHSLPATGGRSKSTTGSGHTFKTCPYC